MKTLLILISITCLITAQGPGNGVSKSTWGASDPQKCLKFNEKYLPMKTSGDSCKNGKCECATQGRAQLNADWSPGPLNGFGVHAINCTYHPYGEMSLMDVEAKFAENFNGFKEYHPFMDFNAGFWMKKSMVDTLISEFQKDGVDFLPLKWTSDDGNEYYSILFSPCGFVVLEIITDNVSQQSIFKESESRFSFAQRNNKPTRHKDYMTPLKVSRATNSLDKVKEFYTSAIGTKMLKTETMKDGGEVATFMFDTVKKGVQLQYWQGRKAVTEIAGSMDVKTLEDYINGVHKEVMVSPVCGFDQWIDNHFAVDFGPGQDNAPSLDDFADHCKKLGLTYHWLQVQMGGAMTQLYVTDPTGWGIQIDGQANNPPSKMPYYSASCKSNDGCSGQGLCNSKAALKQFLRDIETVPEYDFENEDTNEITTLAESPVAFVDHQWLIIALALAVILASAGAIIYYVKRKRAQNSEDTVLDDETLITKENYQTYEPPQKNQVSVMQ